MAKKKFLLPGERFFSEEPYLIVSIACSNYITITFYDCENKYGGMVSLDVIAQASSGLLESQAEVPEINSILETINECGIKLEDVEANIFSALSQERTINGGEIRSSVNTIAKEIEGSGCKEVNTEVKEARGMKVYFKNWDNSLRSIETAECEFCNLKENRSSEDKNIKIVIVDDSQLVQNILARTIGEDYDMAIVGTASDAFSATEEILVKNPDVVILDVVMPHINGLKYLQSIMRYYPKPVIIFSTMGKSGGDIEKQAYEIGAVDVLDKRSLNLSSRDSIEYIKEKVRAASKYLVMKREKGQA